MMMISRGAAEKKRETRSSQHPAHSALMLALNFKDASRRSDLFFLRASSSSPRLRVNDTSFFLRASAPPREQYV